MQAQMTSDKTARKVQGASYAAAAASVVIYFLKIYVIKDTPLPEPVELALGLVISGIVSWGATWIVGRQTRPAVTDTIEITDSSGTVIAEPGPVPPNPIQ